MGRLDDFKIMNIGLQNEKRHEDDKVRFYSTVCMDLNFDGSWRCDRSLGCACMYFDDFKISAVVMPQ